MTRAVEVFIFLLRGGAGSGHPGTSVYREFWALGAEDLRSGFHSVPISRVSWACSKNWGNWVIWYLLLLVVRRRYGSSPWSLRTWPDSDSTHGSCQLFSWGLVFGPCATTHTWGKDVEMKGLVPMQGWQRHGYGFYWKICRSPFLFIGESLQAWTSLHLKY